jgi:flagellar protein FlgJ
MSIPAPDNQAPLAMDVQALGRLKQAAKAQSPAALKETAQQFEALFINMMLKSMRQASPQGGLAESSDGQLYTSMLDQQLSQVMAKRGIGLADMMLRQLSATSSPPLTEPSNAKFDAAQAALEKPQAPSVSPPSAPSTALSGTSLVDEFRNNMRGPAEAAARITGLPAEFIMGQAALESGWGKREIVSAQGQNSFNLFGIKATPAWKGATVEVMTTEYVDGAPRKVMAKFRAYDSYDQAFEDYARLLTRSKRYEGVLANGQSLAGFAQGMQSAGYATDPAYAAKLTRIIQKNLLS